MTDLPWEGASQFPDISRKMLQLNVDVERFALAGNATLTVVSNKSGVRYTFKVQKPDDFKPERPIWFVKVMRGPDNTTDFAYMGQIKLVNGLYRYERGQKCWPTFYPASEAFTWFWKQTTLRTEPDVHPNIQVWHEGRCGKCGRKLTVPSSIDSGFGPECAGNV